MIAFVANNNSGSISFKISVTHEQLVKLIQDASKVSKDISKFGTELFKAALKVDPNVELGGGYNWQAGLPESIAVNIETGKVNIYEPNSYKSKWQGTLSEFAERSNPLNELNKLKDKLVRFVYKGGSTRGVRIVTVSSVEQLGSGVLLKGVDLVHAHDPKDKSKGHRSYKLELIDGKIETLN